MRSASETRCSSDDRGEAVGARRPRLVADAVGEEARELQLGRGLADDDALGCREWRGRARSGESSCRRRRGRRRRCSCRRGRRRRGSAAACSLRKPSPTSSSRVPAASRKRRIVQIVVPVRGDGRDRRGQPGAVGQARLDAWGDPVEPLALHLLEQPLDEGAHLAVVVEDEVGDALDPLAGVAEEALGAVDHPLLRDRVGEHPLGDRARARSSSLRSSAAIAGALLGSRAQAPARSAPPPRRSGASPRSAPRCGRARPRSRGSPPPRRAHARGERGRSPPARASATCVTAARPPRLARASRGRGGTSRSFRSRGSRRDGQEELIEQPRRARGRRRRAGAPAASGRPVRWARASARPSQGSQASSAKRRSASCAWRSVLELRSSPSLRGRRRR